MCVYNTHRTSPLFPMSIQFLPCQYQYNIDFDVYEQRHRSTKALSSHLPFSIPILCSAKRDTNVVDTSNIIMIIERKKIKFQQQKIEYIYICTSTERQFKDN